MSVNIQLLTANDLPLLHGLVALFGDVFDDVPRYTARPPRPEYLCQLLAGDCFIALVALNDNQVVAGLAAYQLQKFEQECSEIYIYDLAVSAAHRRQGLATDLIRELQHIGAERGATVIFVQADTDEDDMPAIALYSKLGAREDVLHFDIPVVRRNDHVT